MQQAREPGTDSSFCKTLSRSMIVEGQWASAQTATASGLLWSTLHPLARPNALGTRGHNYNLEGEFSVLSHFKYVAEDTTHRELCFVPC